MNTQKVTDLDIARKLVQLENSARKRNLDFNLNATSVRNMLKAKKCFFTGVELTAKNRSVDRLDASKGYVKGNVAACTTQFNHIKGNLTPDMIRTLVKKLKIKID